MQSLWIRASKKAATLEMAVLFRSSKTYFGLAFAIFCLLPHPFYADSHAPCIIYYSSARISTSSCVASESSKKWYRFQRPLLLLSTPQSSLPCNNFLQAGWKCVMNHEVCVPSTCHHHPLLPHAYPTSISCTAV